MTTQISTENVREIEVRQLLTELRRHVTHFQNSIDPYAKAGLGRNIQIILAEIRRRGFVVHIVGDTYTLHMPDYIDMDRAGGATERITGEALCAHVFFHIHNAHQRELAAGNELERRRYNFAMLFLLKLWGVTNIKLEDRKLEFGGI